MNKEYQSVPDLFYGQIPGTGQKFQSLKCPYLGRVQNQGSIYKIHTPKSQFTMPSSVCTERNLIGCVVNFLGTGGCLK